MILINERIIGSNVSSTQAKALVESLAKQGYECAYAPTFTGFLSAGTVKPRHWTKALRYSERATENIKPVRNLADLPLAERLEIMERACAYLTSRLCADLFPDASTNPAPVDSEQAQWTVSEVEEILA